MKQKMIGLQVIINTHPAPPCSLMDLALNAILGGADSIQFRHKEMYSQEIYSFACQLSEICDRFSVPLIVNDRLDIALSIQAAGVHLGQTDLPLMEARQLLGDKKIIGCTASNIAQAKQAEMDGADYIGFGHIYPTKTKTKLDPPVGLEALEYVTKQINIPIFAIGGINEQNIDQVCSTGVSGIALISAICFSSDPFSTTQKFKKIMEGYGNKTH